MAMWIKIAASDDSAIQQQSGTWKPAALSLSPY